MQCSQLTGVGPQISKKLAKLNIISILDLLLHLPFRYEDRTTLTQLNKLIIGQMAVVEGEIIDVETSRNQHANLLCHISDNNSTLTLRFLHFSQQQKTWLQRAKKVRAFGEIRWNKSGTEIIHPEYQLLSDTKDEPLPTTLTPIYPTTSGLSQNLMRKLINQALNMLTKNPLPEYLPNLLPTTTDALNQVHHPDSSSSLSTLIDFQHPAQQRLILEELTAQQLALLSNRKTVRQQKAKPLITNNTLFTQLLETLPFQLTASQKRVIKEISYDLTQPTPMLRLLQGDVGCGKTVVAVAAILQCIANGSQAVIMAPTEILSEQHYQNFCQWLQPLNIEITYLSSKIVGKNRAKALSDITSGKAQIAIGTHALLQEHVKFNNLALVIIDEQHRFGVHQRLTLFNKGITGDHYPHQLIMTATPIPRTLAMLAYADLDCSVIDEMPPGRKPVTTTVINSNRRSKVLDRVQASCQHGQQAYWVCPLIEESEYLQCEAAENTFRQLSQELHNLSVGLIHGRMPQQQKQEMMRQFKSGVINLLVATTVIEVGVDVPNASLMIIENSERLGLSQQHQLRGRVGRNSNQSHCVLLYQHPLSQLAKERLQIMRASSDGFVIAQKDLELRGPGELLGTRQTGLMQLRIADLNRDKILIDKAQDLAVQLVEQQPDVVEGLLNRWLKSRTKYSDV